MTTPQFASAQTPDVSNGLPHAARTLFKASAVGLVVASGLILASPPTAAFEAAWASGTLNLKGQVQVAVAADDGTTSIDVPDDGTLPPPDTAGLGGPPGRLIDGGPDTGPALSGDETFVPGDAGEPTDQPAIDPEAFAEVPTDTDLTVVEDPAGGSPQEWVDPGDLGTPMDDGILDGESEIVEDPAGGGQEEGVDPGDPGTPADDGTVDAESVIVEDPAGGGKEEGVDPGELGTPADDGSVDAESVIVEDPAGSDEGEGVAVGDLGESPQEEVFDGQPFITYHCILMINDLVFPLLPLETFPSAAILQVHGAEVEPLIAETQPLMLSRPPLPYARTLISPTGDTVAPSENPIPGTLALLPLGLALGAGLRRRRR